MCIFFFTIAFSFSGVIYGQSISTPTVTGTPVCGGSSVQVTFTVTNANGNGNTDSKRFYPSTVYNVFDRTGNEEFSTGSFTSSSAPADSAGSSAIITITVPIPSNSGLYPTNSDYQIRVSTSTPSANSLFSDTFTVNNNPTPKPIAGNNEPLCIGGTLNLSASDINGATYNWTGPNGFTSKTQNPVRNNANINMAGIYRVTATINGCTSEEATTEVPGSVSLDNKTIRGTNSWVGHVYDGINFNNYVGYYETSFFFDEGFGGNRNCFDLTSNGNPISIYTETFSVIYKANINASGVYTLNIGADDGNRLRVDDVLVYDDWSDHGYRENTNIALSLSGRSTLDLEFYENGGGNRISVETPQLIIENILATNTSQKVCQNENTSAISGDTFRALPSGITLAGTGYQWYYNTNGDPSNISLILGETNADYTPDLTTTPFNNPGNYYIYRKVLLNGSNNTAQIEHISNAATLDISSSPTLSITGPTTACLGESIIIEATFQGQSPYTVTYEVNGSPTTTTENQDYKEYTFNITGDTTIEFTNLIDANSCTTAINELITITVLDNSWTGAVNRDWNNQGNWSCNSIPSLTSDATIPSDISDYPILNNGAVGTVRNLIIEPNASLEILENTLQIAGSITNAGDFNSRYGTIEMLGNSSQTIPPNTFVSNRVNNLIINNINGVSLLGDLEINGFLRVVQNLSIFYTGDMLTLISDASQTALIDGSGNGQVEGLVSMQRYLDRAFGYKYFSSPFQNSVVGDFVPYMDFEDPVSGFPNFYRYNENRNVSINNTIRDATGWEVYTNTSNTLNKAEGYALNFGTASDAQIIDIIGEVNNGVIPTRTLENNHREFTRGFHLVGNPYPSPIDWNATQGWTRNNIDDGIYFFTASTTNQYTGTYTAYVNNISTGNASVDGRSSNIIPSMQGFFIKVSDSETQDLITGSFGMDNMVRVIDFEQEFLRSPFSEQKPIIRLEAGFNDANQKDPMVIYFSSFATANFEKEMDAHKLMNTDPEVPSFYNITETKKELAINAIPFPESKSYKKIRLGIKADKSGKMNINLSSVENLSSNFNVYLIDHEKTIGQNLRDNPEYTFNIQAGTHNSRFELMFSEEEITSPAIAFNKPFDVEVEDGNVVIFLNLEDNQEGILRASTITGQILQTKKGSGKDRVIIDGITSNGVYIINLQVGKEQHAKKILINR